MGAEDVERQRLNVFRMELLGAKVRSVTSGSSTLKDAVNEAIKDWVEHIDNTFYLIGSAVGPHPYPLMVREFQKIIGQEARNKYFKKKGAFQTTCWLAWAEVAMLLAFSIRSCRTPKLG